MGKTDFDVTRRDRIEQDSDKPAGSENQDQGAGLRQTDSDIPGESQPNQNSSQRTTRVRATRSGGYAQLSFE